MRFSDISEGQAITSSGVLRHLMKKALKKDGLSVQNIGKPQVAFLFAVFLYISLSWIKQQDLAVVILYKTFLTLEPLLRGHPWGREGMCPPGGKGRGVVGVLLGILGGGVPPGSSNPDPISAQKMLFCVFKLHL